MLGGGVTEIAKVAGIAEDTLSRCCKAVHSRRAEIAEGISYVTAQALETMV